MKPALPPIDRTVRPDRERAAPVPGAERQRRAPRPATPVPPIAFPESLPVSARRDEIARAMQDHQVVIVSGETGSGKTTQLPKIALSLGRGRGAGGAGLIGHTQPRRIAASSVAKRIAEELDSPLGEVVGYKVRFQDRLQPGASVKLMTDGILLAETQTDPELRAYDTLIIDEAHERSLNIDFLLGYLRQLLPRRPDLKVVITSATIDAERFARHFAGADGPAPVISVSGRLFPVEQRWRPYEESRSFDLNDAIADAVDELWREGSGDILVFLPGEREIREAADHLRRHAAADARRGPVEVLPLFSRLSQAEQDQVFRPGNGRRIVLATNVAETSLTVPGIRYVVDSGLARVKRYSYRNKVEQLQVEAVSQAAANQRAGRCGRVADGVCIRLYDEQDFAGRPRFTDPEILRSSLAGVILRMKALRLGEIEDFPFVEPPRPKAIADGHALLAELGAVDGANALTAIGRELARLPLDPRIGRMILEARERQALAEVLVIAAALSVQDVRDRPLDQQQAADQKHKPFDDEKSEFAGTLKLWQWIEAGRGVHGHADASAQKVDTHKLSNRQQEQRLREHFISPRRVREWRDIHSQLHTVVAEQGWRLNGTPATYEQLHLSLLAGLLGNVGLKSDEDDWYLGARGIKFWKHPGANLSKKPARWIMVAELVETTRLFGRGIAAIEPPWLERLGGHLLQRQLSDPQWDRKTAEVIAHERGTLYGLPVYSGRRVNFARVDPAAAREVFIRQALVEGEWESPLPFLAHNRKLMRQVQELEHKSRRQDVLVDDALIFGFYDAQLPADVASGRALERWWREASRDNPKLLHLSREELMRHEAAGVTTDAFPKLVRLGGVDCAATYLHEPGDARDGLTVTVPLFALNQVSEERCEWLVPGMLKDKVAALVKSLHQKPRARVQPVADFVAEFCELAPFGEGSLLQRLLEAVRERTQLAVQRNDFKLETLSLHHFMNVRVVDEHGRQLGMGRQLAALKSELGGQARSAFQALASLKVKTAVEAVPTGKGAAPTPAAPAKAAGPAVAAGARHTAWDFGELPELMELQQRGQTLVGFPALIDKGTHVEIGVFDEPEVAATRHRAGLRRLLSLQLKEPIKALEKQLPELQKMAVLYMPLGTPEELRGQILDVALDRAFLNAPLPTDKASFDARLAEGRGRFVLIAQEVARLALTVLTEGAAAQRKLKDSRPPKEVSDDIDAQLKRLVPKRFLLDTPWEALAHLPRYLKGVVLRLDKSRADPARDAQRLAELKPLEQRWTRRLAERKGVHDPRLEEFRWLLEELRVSLFAQELRTPQPVSVKRLEKAWAQMA
ncbi:ATP-dependent RNA helicase HrpA [Aquabacterium sp. J223]|uniref:ATP-dependent RNA helicase HrpA n=1 Tax=Aquabacterium sp. J223 TaxID=2898431 RepID=UPI0021AE1A29|nr:ATP-dependent RNA helicase HrpA [Aquabacterium sp. J223]UUX94217.1 ATP-dependent RNA helicase HrpA [Aquabacterium sp. J223]